MDPQQFTTMANKFQAVLDADVLNERGKDFGFTKRECIITPFRLSRVSVLSGTLCHFNDLPKWPDDVALAWATPRSVTTRSQTDREKRPPEKPRRRCRLISGPTIEVMQRCPHLIATHRQAAMVVLHLREVAVASLNRRRGPLERPDMIASPRLPTRQHLGCELPGAWMPRKSFFNHLEHERNLGFLPWTARAMELLWPVLER
jgi:hypothetical protein